MFLLVYFFKISSIHIISIKKILQLKFLKSNYIHGEKTVKFIFLIILIYLNIRGPRIKLGYRLLYHGIFLLVCLHRLCLKIEESKIKNRYVYPNSSDVLN